MRIACPYCGSRDVSEFSYLGDAAPQRPPLGTEDGVFEYVHLRDNAAEPIDELWYHAAGCRTWLRVTRDTRTHEITGVGEARRR